MTEKKLTNNTTFICLLIMSCGSVLLYFCQPFLQPRIDLFYNFLDRVQHEICILIWVQPEISIEENARARFFLGGAKICIEICRS